MKKSSIGARSGLYKKVFLSALGLWSLVAVSALVGGAEALPEFSHNISVDEIMESIVMPAADELWSSVSINMTLNGEEVSKPETEEQWLELRHSAVRLATSTNLLLVPGTPVVPKSNPRDVGVGELNPDQIAALMKTNWPAWQAHVQVLHEVSMQMLQAVDKRSTDDISEIGGALDEACESCHLQFWYPNQ